jgi:hypothetical protein
LQAASAALMTSLGVWACQWRELRPIAFGGTGNQVGSSQHETVTGGEENDGHVARFPRGRGRGRNRDGGGEYEMVGMKEYPEEPA